MAMMTAVATDQMNVIAVQLPQVSNAVLMNTCVLVAASVFSSRIIATAKSIAKTNLMKLDAPNRRWFYRHLVS